MIAMALTCWFCPISQDIPKYIKENTVDVVVVIGRLMENVCCYIGLVSNTNSGSDTHLKLCHC
jgi:hypothetical protein